ncbi:MAG: purine phosphorylase [Gammaproteobacteria bacterium]|nr:MAG: purine phosphorylase [Gammaproteobacteria bacterium]
MKIVVVFPTSTEAKFFSHPDVVVEICGVGLTAAAYRTSKIIAQYKPDWLIMAGIAGVYTHSVFKVDDVVLIESECEADLGFFTATGFTHLADLKLDMEFSVTKKWLCPYLPQQQILPIAKSNSMNAAMAPFVNIANVDIENMEGAAFFQVCLAERQKFLQLRSISNVVKIGDEDWDMEGSIRSLTTGLHKLIDYLLAQESGN